MSSAFLAVLSASTSNVFTRFNTLFEYACTVSRAEVTFVCTASYALLATRTTHTDTLATGERAREAICSLACCFAQRVLGCATGEVRDAFLELKRIGLIGSRDLIDLVWWLLACDQPFVVSMSADLFPDAHYQIVKRMNVPLAT